MSSNGSNSTPSVVYYSGLDPQEFAIHPEYRMIAAFFLGALFISSLSSVVYSPIFKSLLTRIFDRNRPDDLEALPITTEKVKGLKRSSSNSTSLLVRRNNGTLGFAMSISFAVAGVAQFGTLFSFTATLACAFVVALGAVGEQCGRVLALIILGFHLRRLNIGQIEFICMWIWVAVATTIILVTNAIGTGTIVNVTNPNFGLCFRTHYLPTTVLALVMYIILEVYIIVRLVILIPRSQRQLGFLTDLRLLRAVSMLVFDLLVIVPATYYITVAAEFVPFCIGTLLVLASFHAHLPDTKMGAIDPPAFVVDINPIRVGPTPGSAAPTTTFNQWRAQQQSQLLSPTGPDAIDRNRSVATSRSYVSGGDASIASADASNGRGAYRQTMGPAPIRTALHDLAPPRRNTGMTSVVSPTMPRFKVVNPEEPRAEPAHSNAKYSSADKGHVAKSEDGVSTISTGAALVGYLHRDTLESEMASLEDELRSPSTASAQFGSTLPPSTRPSRRRDSLSTVFPDPRDYADNRAMQRRVTNRSRPTHEQRLSTITSATVDTVISDLSFIRAPKIPTPLPYPSQAQAFAASASEYPKSVSEAHESNAETLADRPPPRRSGTMPESVRRPSLERKPSPPREIGAQVRGPRAPKSALSPDFDPAQFDVPTYTGKGKGRKRSSSIY